MLLKHVVNRHTGFVIVYFTYSNISIFISTVSIQIRQLKTDFSKKQATIVSY